MAISEVIAHGVWEALGLVTLDACLVDVAEPLWRGWRNNDAIDYDLLPGMHFGTRWRRDVNAMEPEWDDIEDHNEIVRLWVVGSWLLTIDRNVFGNVLMPLGHTGRFRLLPGDNSDCFGGAKTFASGGYVAIARERGGAPPWNSDYLMRALMDGGTKVARVCVKQILQFANTKLKDVFERIPPRWWQDAGVSSSELMPCMLQRADRLLAILNQDVWSGAGDAIKGGIELKLDL